MSSPRPASSPLAQWRALWWQFTLRAIEMRHRGSYLGFVWAVLTPLCTAALYVLVFGYIFNGRFGVLPGETGKDYAIGVFLGLLLFHLVAETLAAAPTIVLSQPNLVKKVVFPVEILPVAQLGAFWFHAMVSLALVALAAATIGHGLSLGGLLWLPIILLPLLCLTVGLGWFLAAAGVYFRDITQIMPLLSQVLLWSSAVFFTPARIAEKSALGWAILKWNPLLHTIDLARSALLWDQPVALDRLAYTWACGLAALALGYTVFRASKRTFAEAL
jgi:lipopolysaccharide transport system permease protein